MLVSNKREKYDGSQRMLLWDTDESGRCVPELRHVEFHEQLDNYLEQRHVEFRRLESLLMAGEISPVSFFMQYQNMTVAEVASRMRLGKSRVTRHMTREGFDEVKVVTLRRYARVFGVVVSDFFSFTHVTDDLGVDVADSGDGLVRRISLSVKDPRPR